MRRIVVFAHYNTEDLVDEYIYHNLRCLRKIAQNIQFISSSVIADVEKTRLLQFCDFVSETQNTGYDFKMWKTVIDTLDLGAWDEIILVNSSIVGPLLPLESVFNRVEISDSDVWGLTSNQEIDWHLQSYFLAFRKKIIQSDVFRQFWNSILPFRCKNQVIRSYEVGLSRFFIESGFKLAAAYSIDWEKSLDFSSKRAEVIRLLDQQNSTIFAPLELLALGMPYIKREVLFNRWLDPEIAPVISRLRSLKIGCITGIQQCKRDPGHHSKIKRNLTLDSPLKVLLSCWAFKTFTGSEMYVYELAKGLKKLNCDVTVLSDIDGPLSKLAQQEGIKVLPFSNPPGYKMGDGKWVINTPQGFQPSQTGMMYKVSEVNYDIIHTQHAPVTNQICGMYPTTDKISTIHSEVIELENPVVHESIKKYICVRPEIQNHIVEKFDIEKNKTEVIYNPIDTKIFNANNTKDDNYILAVGTIDYLRENAIKDLVTYSKEVGKELWLVGENKSNYLDELLKIQHIKYFNATSRVETFVKNCSETAGILLGRITIEGWMCGKPGWIYNVDSSGYIVDKKLHEPPNDLVKFDSIEVAKKIKEEYIKILN